MTVGIRMGASSRWLIAITAFGVTVFEPALAEPRKGTYQLAQAERQGRGELTPEERAARRANRGGAEGGNRNRPPRSDVRPGGEGQGRPTARPATPPASAAPAQQTRPAAPRPAPPARAAIPAPPPPAATVRAAPPPDAARIPRGSGTYGQDGRLISGGSDRSDTQRAIRPAQPGDSGRGSGTYGQDGRPISGGSSRQESPRATPPRAATPRAVESRGDRMRVDRDRRDGDFRARNRAEPLRSGGVRDGRFDEGAGRRLRERDGRRPSRDWRRDARARPEIIRRSDNIVVERRRFRASGGRARYAESRRYWVRDRRYANRFDRRGRSIYWLPPVIAGAAVLGAGAYYLSSSRASRDDYITTFMAPPVRRFDRSYTLDEVIYDPEIRSAMRSVELDIVQFPSGSAEIPEDQLDRLEELAEAVLATLKRRPGERFLIEGHTDAVGSEDENLELSQRRAAAVQEALIEEFGVPADSLESVGYGEQYLLIDTDQSEPRNRRVVIRAIGALLSDRR